MSEFEDSKLYLFLFYFLFFILFSIYFSYFVLGLELEVIIMSHITVMVTQSHVTQKNIKDSGIVISYSMYNIY